MPPEEITIVIDNEKEDDWMKSLPGYKNEAKIIRSIMPKQEQPEPPEEPEEPKLGMIRV